MAQLTKQQKKFKAFVLEEVDTKRGDQLMTKDVFNAMNADAFMKLEIHELLESGKIDFVHPDNSHSVEHGGEGLRVEEIETDTETLRVLCLPTDVHYSDWRPFYDDLISEK